MPHIIVKMFAGRSDEVKQQLAHALTKTLIDTLGSSEKEELLVRDLDLDMVQQMRDDWQFYRDRRPDSYGRIAQP